MMFGTSIVAATSFISSAYEFIGDTSNVEESIDMSADAGDSID